MTKSSVHACTIAAIGPNCHLAADEIDVSIASDADGHETAEVRCIGELVVIT